MWQAGSGDSAGVCGWVRERETEGRQQRRPASCHPLAHLATKDQGVARTRRGRSTSACCPSLHDCQCTSIPKETQRKKENKFALTRTGRSTSACTARR